MKFPKVIILTLVLASCHNHNINNEQDTVANNNNDTIKDYDAGTSDPAETVSSCYESISHKDTVFLSIFGSSKIITGALTYHYYEKDKNNGTLRGTLNGDTLIAEYIFMSEGKASIRQVAFLKQDNNFIEGYGDMEEWHGKMIFRDVHAISFTGSSLHIVDCSEH